MLDLKRVQCPWCGESFQTTVDGSAGSTEYVEDCQVCCQPILIRLDAGPDGEELDLQVARDD